MQSLSSFVTRHHHKFAIYFQISTQKTPFLSLIKLLPFLTFFHFSLSLFYLHDSTKTGNRHFCNSHLQQLFFLGFLHPSLYCLSNLPPFLSSILPCRRRRRHRPCFASIPIVKLRPLKTGRKDGVFAIMSSLDSVIVAGILFLHLLRFFDYSKFLNFLIS